jgi:putative membrane protein
MSSLLLAHHHGPYAHGGWFPWFPLVPLFFFGLWLTLFLTVGRRWRQPYRQSGESVLAERYARGEIDEDEYRHRRSVLRSKG